MPDTPDQQPSTTENEDEVSDVPDIEVKKEKEYARNKDPPPLHKAKSYEDWLLLLDFWQEYTTLPLNKQGPTLILTLQDEALEAALELKKEDVSSNNGIKNIITKLDSIYKKDKTIKNFKHLEDFEDYRRKNESIDQYLIEFEKRLNKTKKFGTTWSEDVLALKLLKNANLSDTQQQLAKATVVTMSYKDMKSKIKNIFGENTPPVASDLAFIQETVNYNEEDNLYEEPIYEDTAINSEYDYNDFNQNFEEQIPEQISEQQNTFVTQNKTFNQRQTPDHYMPPIRSSYNQQRFFSQPRIFNNNQRYNRQTSFGQGSYQGSYNPRRFYTQQGQQRFNNRQGQYRFQQPSQPIFRNQYKLQNPNQSSTQRVNPPSRCSICQSINHWAASCPEKSLVDNSFNTMFSDMDL